MKAVFLSHAEEDQRLALDLAQELKVSGYSTWCYESDSLPGRSYLLNTRDGIDECGTFILLVSVHSMRSHQVDIEMERAHEQAKPIIPVLLGVTDAEYKKKKPLWAQIIGTSTSIALTPMTIQHVAQRIASGLRNRDVTMAEGVSDLPCAEKGIERKDIRYDRRYKCTLLSLLLIGLIVAMGVVGSLMKDRTAPTSRSAPTLMDVSADAGVSRDVVASTSRSKNAETVARVAQSMENMKAVSDPQLSYTKLVLTDAHSAELMEQGTYRIFSGKETESISTFWLQPVDLSSAYEIRLTIQTVIPHKAISIMLRDHGILKSDNVILSCHTWKYEGKNEVFRIPAKAFKTQNWDMKTVRAFQMTVAKQSELAGFRVRLISIEAGFLK